MNNMNIMKALQEPFLPDEIEWRVGATSKDKTKGLALAYVTNRAIQNRLDEVFGCFGWRNEYREWKGNSQICGISIYNKETSEWITKWDGADDSDMEGTKGGLSDAMKRAAYQWGIGRYLYKMPSVWVPIKQFGRSYALANIPSIPKEFLPKDKIGKAETPQIKQSKPKEPGPKVQLYQEIVAIANEIGETEDDVKAEIKKRYNKTSGGKVTVKEFEDLINYYIKKVGEVSVAQ